MKELEITIKWYEVTNPFSDAEKREPRGNIVRRNYRLSSMDEHFPDNVRNEVLNEVVKYCKDNPVTIEELESPPYEPTTDEIMEKLYPLWGNLTLYPVE